MAPTPLQRSMQSLDITPAIDQVFGTYYSYCTAPKEETLFHLLTALETLDKGLREATAQRVSFDFSEYVALRALRKMVNSVTYARNVLRLKQLPRMPVETDTRQACLVSRSDCVVALLREHTDSREATKLAFNASFKQWGSVVDVNPCVLNCMVKVYDVLSQQRLAGKSTAFRAFQESWDYEALNNLPHYVTGPQPIGLHSAEEVNELMTALYSEEKGA